MSIEMLVLLDVWSTTERVDGLPFPVVVDVDIESSHVNVDAWKPRGKSATAPTDFNNAGISSKPVPLFTSFW